MTIKGFKVGQTVVIVGDGGVARASRRGRVEAMVTKVGRKYVSAMPVGGGYEAKYREPESETCGYLIEQTETGSPRLLLPSIHAADAYYEAEELRRWLINAAGWSSVYRYSLEQLRKVKQILEFGRSENNPLTLDDLLDLDGQPVWVISPSGKNEPCWMLVDVEYELCREAHGGLAIFDTYGKNWIAYRNKMEEGQ